MILLTGATGFVGRNLLLRLLAENRDVAAPVRDPQKLARQLADEGVDAGRVHVLPADPAAWPDLPLTGAVLGAGVLFARSRAEYWSVNVDWTLAGLRRVPVACPTVVVSSQAAGGPTPPHREARDESDEDAPITWYGESKLALERAVAADFSQRPLAILRPPMVLGARDTATLPLFRMARGLVRLKPGLRPKAYSFIAVDDLVEAILAALARPTGVTPCFVANDQVITDGELIAGAAAAVGGRGLTLPVPELFVRALSRVVDAVPALREKTPSLTRDRARDIWADRWVVSAQRFSQRTGWTARQGLTEALQSACAAYRREGLL